MPVPPQIIPIGDYIINYYPDDKNYWLYHKSGEGMELNEKLELKLAELIHKFYEKHF